jgi:hypothetical protein
MRLKLTLFLALLNIALFSYIFYLESDARKDEGTLGRLVLDSATISQADAISLSGQPVAVPWRLAHTNNRWMVEEPVQWVANPYAVQRLLELLSFLRWETRFTVDSLERSGKTLEDYGLGRDAATLSIAREGAVTQLRLGRPTEIGNRLYVLSPDQSQIFVVQAQILEGVSFDIDSLIERQLVEIPTFEARSFNLTVGNTNAVRVQVARENDRWVFNAPIRVAADSEKVNSSIDVLNSTEVVGFTDPANTAHGLANPALRLNLNGNNRQQTLLLGNLVEGSADPVLRYAKLEARPSVVTVPAAPFEIWFKAQETLRQRRFMELDPAQIGSVEVRFGAEALTLQRLEGGQWQIVESRDGNLNTRPADQPTVDQLLENLAHLEALRFVTDAPSASDLERFGFNDPQRRLSVRLDNGERRTLLIGGFVTEESNGTRENRLYAKREASSSVYLTSSSILYDFPLNPLHYRERVAGSLPAGASITTLRLRDLADDALILELRRPAGTTWNEVLADIPGEADRAAADTMLRAFRRFEVRRFVADDFTDPLSLDADTSLPWRFAMEAEVRLPGGTEDERETRRYVLTERRGGLTQYGGSERLDLTFVLPQPLIDALHPLLFQRPRPDAERNTDPAPVAPTEPVTTP